MGENNVTVTIQSLQTGETGTESMTQHAQGLLLREGGDWILTYREGAESGLGSTRTTLRMERGRVTLNRTGELKSQMVFEVGRPHTSLYETPYGKLPMTIRTLKLKTELTEAGGTVLIHYHIELGGGSAGETRLRLTLRKEENAHDR